MGIMAKRERTESPKSNTDPRPCCDLSTCSSGILDQRLVCWPLVVSFLAPMEAHRVVVAPLSRTWRSMVAKGRDSIIWRELCTNGPLTAPPSMMSPGQVSVLGGTRFSVSCTSLHNPTGLRIYHDHNLPDPRTYPRVESMSIWCLPKCASSRVVLQSRLSSSCTKCTRMLLCLAFY